MKATRIIASILLIVTLLLLTVGCGNNDESETVSIKYNATAKINSIEYLEGANKIKLSLRISVNSKGGLIIKTLEGEHLASIGDYIIKGVKGEFYPCKPDIFEQTYEELKGSEE